MRFGQSSGKRNIAAEPQTLHEHVVAAGGKILCERDSPPRPSVLQTDRIAAAARDIIVAEDDQRAVVVGVLQAVSIGRMSSRNEDRFYPVQSGTAFPAIFRKYAPHEFCFSRSTCASWIDDKPHSFTIRSRQVG